VGLGGLDVLGLQHRGDHDEVLGHALGVLLAQGAQLLVDTSVELLAGDVVADARLGAARGLRRQAAATALLRRIGCP
jgi:hypothetical protein